MTSSKLAAERRSVGTRKAESVGDEVLEEMALEVWVEITIRVCLWPPNLVFVESSRASRAGRVLMSVSRELEGRNVDFFNETGLEASPMLVSSMEMRVGVLGRFLSESLGLLACRGEGSGLLRNSAQMMRWERGREILASVISSAPLREMRLDR